MNPGQRDLLLTGATAMGVALDDSALQFFSVYSDLLRQWGKKINLTARLEADEVLAYHFLDSLAGAPSIASTPDARVVDLGTGAGLPGLALKFALPGLRVLLLESVRKKIAFCQTVIRTTGIVDVMALWGRAEEIGRHPEHHRSYDWAVSRALGAAADVAKLAHPFLAPGGRMLLYKGEPDAAELQALDALCNRHQASWSIQSVIVPHIHAARSLVTVVFP